LLPLQSSLRTNFQSFVGHLIFQLTFQPTSDSRRILHRPVLPSNSTPGFRQTPRLPAFLLDRPPTCVRYRILQFCLPINFRLIIGYRISDFAFRSASDLRQRSIFGLSLRINLRLASAAVSPVLSAINSQLPRRLHPSISPSVQPPTCADCCSSGLPSGPTSNPSSDI